MYIHFEVYFKKDTLSIVWIRLAANAMKAIISVDQRVSDGAEAAQFMQALAGYLENPVRMLV